MRTIILGNFDGVHVGHQALVRKARDYSRDGEVVAVTFDTHPAALTRGESPARLSSPTERARLLTACGVTRVDSIEVTRSLLKQTPHEFIASLHARLQFDAVVEGSDFRFGHNRCGDIETLRAIGRQLHFESLVVDEVDVALHDGQLVSARSSIARWLLARGRVADASLVLGRDHTVTGPVVEGERRGRTLGFPTANIAPCDAVLPADGVYEVIVKTHEGQSWRGAASVGTNPTFGVCPRTLEVHMPALPIGADLYGQTLRVSFSRWIREMLRFDSVQTLIDQMKRDCAAVVA